jgi:hypothetical protein
MPVVSAKVVKIEGNGNGLVEFTKPLEDERYGVLQPQTLNFGRIWDRVRVGSSVSVDVELRPDFLPIVKKIDLIP